MHWGLGLGLKGLGGLGMLWGLGLGLIGFRVDALGFRFGVDRV